MFHVSVRLHKPISIIRKVIRQKHKYPKEVRDRINFSKVPKSDFEGTDKNDVIESAVRGSGAGGQAVAKTSNAIQLTHSPTGVVVKVHETRSVDQNRKLARLKLIDALDKFYNGEESVENQAQKIQHELKEQKKIESKQNLDQKRLPKLRQKEDKLIDKISKIRENPQNYFDPEQKIVALQRDLDNIKIDIQKEETRIKLINSLQTNENHETDDKKSRN